MVQSKAAIFSGVVECGRRTLSFNERELAIASVATVPSPPGGESQGEGVVIERFQFSDEAQSQAPSSGLRPPSPPRGRRAVGRFFF